MPSLHRQLQEMLAPHYGLSESRAMVRVLLADVAGLSLTDIAMGRDDELPKEERARLLGYADRMAKGEPLQYVIGRTTFCGLEIGVEPGVLIPRPETEELVAWALESIDDLTSANKKEAESIEGIRPLRLLDVCTGSGCIALALKSARRQDYVEAWDISPEALSIARGNAERLLIDVEFIEENALANKKNAESIEQSGFDIIVSNPPYICHSEAAEMEANVLEHEPALALFVSDADPLCFYRAIGQMALQRLRPHGMLLFELNRRFATETAAMLRALGFAHTELRNDQFGNPRMLRAWR